MNPNFDLNHEKLANAPVFASFGKSLSTQSHLQSREDFNLYCRRACQLWKEYFGNAPAGTSALFAELLLRIDHREEGTIHTPWGGVVIVLHEYPRVEKYLVVREAGYLALEKHAEKDEHLEVKEGAGLILWRSQSDQALTVQALAAGDRFHFEPGMEHCLIGTEDLLVFERGTDPKGMDQDLIFIFEPDSALA